MCVYCHFQKGLLTLKRYAEAIHRRTGNTMAKKKKKGKGHAYFWIYKITGACVIIVCFFPTIN